MAQSSQESPRAACRFVRLAETGRPGVTIFHDGRPLAALAGDTLLTALLCNGVPLRRSEFDDGLRAGFCNMGACQDCWVVLEDGGRIRACTTEVQEGMRVRGADWSCAPEGSRARDGSCAPEGSRARDGSCAPEGSRARSEDA